MAIEELRRRVSALEVEATQALSLAIVEHQHPGRRLGGGSRDKINFWTDARNGLRQAEDALHALELIEKGGDWA